jgi:hypothetical protein
MSAHELTVEWPAFFATKHRIAEREAENEKQRRRRVG